MGEPSASTASTTEGRSRARWLAALALLFLLPLALRLAPIEHGMPRNYVPDTHVVRNALGMARDKDPIPPVNRYSSYPYLVSYMLLPIYAGQYALGRVRGDWGGAGEFGYHALEHPASVQLPARVLVAVLGALTVWIVFRTARRAGLEVGAWAAAWLVATGLLHAHFSVQERPWVPMVFFMAASAWPAADYAWSGKTRSLLFSAAFAGLAFACHQAGLFALAIPTLAWLASGLAWKGRLRQVFALVLCFTFVALVLGHPYLLRYGMTPESEVVGGVQDADSGVRIGGQRMLLQFSAHTFQRLTLVFFGYDPVVLVLGVLGLLAAIGQRALRPVGLFCLLWGSFFLSYHNDHVRYLLPLAVFLAWPAGLIVERMFAAKGILRPLAVALLVFPLVQVVRFDIVMRRPDTRALAEERLKESANERWLAIDRYGPDIELDRESLERLTELRTARGETLRQREAHRAAMLEAGVAPEPGIRAVRVEELFGFDDRVGAVLVREELRHLGDSPRAVLEELGVTRLLLVDRRPGDDRASPFAGLDLAPIWVLGPRADARGVRECRLPWEMDFALTALWSVERPGPRLAFYEL